MTAPGSRTKVFISYCHADSTHLRRLHQALEPYRRAGVLDVWDDTRMRAGERWRQEIEKALESAKVAILLVSIDFLASKFIAEHELPPLLIAAEFDGAVIVPVVVGPCPYADTELAQFQAVNDPKRPLSLLPAKQRDVVWVKVVERVKEALVALPTSPSGFAMEQHLSSIASSYGELSDPLGYGSRLCEQGRYKEAVALAIRLNKLGRHSEATMMLRLVTHSQPDDSRIVPAYRVWFERAYALAKLHQQEEAREAFLEAYRLDQFQLHGVAHDVGMRSALFSVFCGDNSGFYSHGLGTEPDDVYVLGVNGSQELLATSVGVNDLLILNMTSDRRWAALAFGSEG